MYVNIFIFSLIFIHSLSTVNSDAPSPDAKGGPGPGASACGYYGVVDASCKFKETPVSGLPKECSAFIYQSLNIDEEHLVSNPDDPSLLSILDDMLKVKTVPTYAFLGHISQDEWIGNLDDKGAGGAADAKGIATFLKAHPGIKGLILEHVDIFSVKDFKTFSSDMDLYVKAVKTANPGLQVGFAFSGVDIQKSSGGKGIDFTCLNDVFDFYVVRVTTDIGECTKELKCGGTVTEASLTKIATFFTTAKVEKSKIHYQYYLTASEPKSQDLVLPCLLSADKICTDPKTADYCAETSTSLTQKGSFAKTNGAGFIASNVDLNDPTGACCEKPFPSFYFLLGGFSGTPAKPCPKFDRQ